MAPKPITIYDVIVLILHANKNSYSGRTVLQKLAYFWTVYISQINEVIYKPHDHGPYSPRLRQAMAELISYAFMDEGTKSGPAFDSYHYMLSDDGRKFAKDAMKDYNSEYSAICRIVRACEERDSVQPGQLADAAKIDYIMRSAKSVEKSDDEIIKDASKLGWRMTKDDVAAGRVLLGEIIQASRNEMRQ